MMMILAADVIPLDYGRLLTSSAVLFLLTGVTVFLGLRPFKDYIREQEAIYDDVLRRKLLYRIRPRSVTVITFVGMALLAFAFFGATESLLGAGVGAVIGVFIPKVLMTMFARRRLARLDSQLVSGIQTLSSGVRAGLNLVQSMELVARDGPIPLRQEFQHMLREYEFGLGLEDAMSNAASRIGSGDFRLLFAALLTHRERGGDLGETLDRISDSIREIQRLENRVKTLTAQGRATARALGAMPIVVLIILYMIVTEDVKELFVDPVGKVLLLGILVLNILGFMWVKKVVSLDI
jgi:tight adherence protein B